MDEILKCIDEVVKSEDDKEHLNENLHQWKRIPSMRDIFLGRLLGYVTCMLTNDLLSTSDFNKLCDLIIFSLRVQE